MFSLSHSRCRHRLSVQREDGDSTVMVVRSGVSVEFSYCTRKRPSADLGRLTSRGFSCNLHCWWNFLQGNAEKVLGFCFCFPTLLNVFGSISDVCSGCGSGRGLCWLCLGGKITLFMLLVWVNVLRIHFQETIVSTLCLLMWILDVSQPVSPRVVFSARRKRELKESL